MKVSKKLLEELNMQRIQFTDKQKDYFTNLIGEYFNVVTYLPLNVVLDQLYDRKSHIHKFILIEHNSADDLYQRELKTYKKEHIHIVVCFIGRHRASSLCNMFNTTEVQRLEKSQEIKGSILYLTHETIRAIAQGKVKYEKSKLISNDIDFFDNIVKNVIDVQSQALQIIDMILLGIPHREMVAFWGRDYVMNYQKYLDMAKLINSQETLKGNEDTIE